MKNNNKKGITMLVLVVTIAIALVLLTTITVSFSKLTQSTKKKEFAKEILAVQNAIDQYKFMNDKYPVTNDVFEISVASTTVSSQFMQEASFKTGTVRLSKIDYYEAGIESLSRGMGSTTDDYYAVSLDTGIVYYVKGQAIGNDLYYRLTDELKNSLNI